MNNMLNNEDKTKFIDVFKKQMVTNSKNVWILSTTITNKSISKWYGKIPEVIKLTNTALDKKENVLLYQLLLLFVHRSSPIL